jgi:hypothetical protein
MQATSFNSAMSSKEYELQLVLLGIQKVEKIPFIDPSETPLTAWMINSKYRLVKSTIEGTYYVQPTTTTTPTRGLGRVETYKSPYLTYQRILELLGIPES